MTQPSPKLVEFARRVTAGESPPRAAIGAGYKESYATHHSHQLVRQARASGMLTTPEEVKAIKDQVNALFEAESLNVAKATIRTAIEGNPVSQKEALARGVGVLPKRHEVSMEDVGAVVDDLLADAARELDPDVYERLRQAWAKRIEARKRP